MKKYILILSSLLGLVILISCNHKGPNVTDVFMGEKRGTVVSADVTPIKYHSDKPLEISKNNGVISNTMHDRTKKRVIYESISIEEATLEIPPRTNIIPIGAIRLDQQAIQSLRTDDIVMITDIEGMDYHLQILDIVENSDGSLSLTAYYNDEGIGYTTTITSSKDVSYIMLSTTQGEYEIETRNGVGYIYKSETIRKKMQDPHLDDSVIFPLPKHSS